MTRLLFSFILIFSSLLVGYVWQQYLKNSGRDESVIPRIRKFLQKVGLLFFMPVSFVGAVWVVSFTDARVSLLPFIGLLSLLFGGLLAVAGSTVLQSSGKEKGTLYCCGSFTNIGSIGALVAFVFLGEQGFGLIALYKMFEEISYYTIGFPVARYYSSDSDKDSLATRLFKIIRDPFVLAAVTAFIAGLFLNLSGIQRPAFFSVINSWFVPVGTALLLISIGLGMRFNAVSGYIRESLMISAIKFVAVPAFAVSLAYLLGFHRIDGGLAFKVVLIAASMPVAFTALVAASIYDLDLDLANSCWLVSTGGLLITLPVLTLLLQVLPF